MQLRSAIQADTDVAARASERAGAAADRLRRPNGWARRVTTELGSVLLETLGLAATIEWHLQQCRKCSGLDYELSVNNTARFDLPEDFAQTLFEIYNEALSNVARHAYASRVTVALAITPDCRHAGRGGQRRRARRMGQRLEGRRTFGHARALPGAQGALHRDRGAGHRHHCHCQPAVRGIAMTTCAERLKSLASCRDALSLKSAVQELCTEFGNVTHIDVLTMAEAEKRRALCFLRLESSAQEQELMRSLGAPRFGEDVLIVVDLPHGSPRPIA